MKTLTRIEAVNRVIEISSGEIISNQTDLNTLPSAVKASGRLDFAVTEILTEFQWFFNSINDVTALADGSGVITLPDNLTYINFCTGTPIAAQYLRPIGGKVYDLKNNTNVLGTDARVTYDARLWFSFEDLPVAFQLLAIAKARLYTASGGSHISPTRSALEQSGWNNAFQTACKFDDTLSGGRSRKYNQARQRPPYNGGLI